jgi:tRNA/tmRNA/rRNA uracil-C5-methylase (TrmA/RlmC/RlmD family)
VPYADEVARKAVALSELFGREVEVAPSPREYGYRTRMDYVFAWHKLGLRKKGDPRGILDLEECLLPERFDLVLKAKEAIHRLGLKSYNYTRHKGYLRYVTLRVAPVSGQTMLIFLTNGRDDAIRPLLDEAAAWADAVVWAVSERRADVSHGEVREHRNRLWIEERIGDVTLRFGPTSFFQANPWQTERLYAHAAERVQGVVADVCCGVGGLALFAARHAERVVGVDNSAEGIAYAEHNAAANGIANVEFRVGDQQDFLREHACDTVILDPPRAGVGFKSARLVAAAAPARIVYVSCNPKVLAKELAHFRGYEVKELAGFDLFPRTPHCELVAVLEPI